MKFTNIKQLIIKFMGGGIINFPTRFLRWVKIVGDTDGSDDGGGDSGKINKINVPIFPIFIGKLVGFVDISDPNWDGNSLTTDDDLISIDGVFDYCENTKNLYGGQWYFAPVFEYDESLDTYKGYNGYLGFGSFEVGADGDNYNCQVYNANTCMPIYIKGVKYLVAWEIGD